MVRHWIVTAAVLGFIGVALGAFGAHGLAGVLEANDRVDTFETANRYHMIHALAVLLVAVLMAVGGRHRALRSAGLLLTLGTVLFSGSLYVLAIFDLGVMGAVAPVGGAALLAGWAALGWAGWQLF